MNIKKIGNITLDSGFLTISFKKGTSEEKTKSLSKFQADLIALLMESEGLSVSRNKIVLKMWLGSYVTNHTINQHISKIRNIIASLGHDEIHIQTIPKVGYSIHIAQDATTEDEQVSKEQAGLRYVYHYCLSYQMIGSQEVVYIDGIARMENKILTMDDYRKLKKLLEPKRYSRSTIKSLTFIGTDVANDGSK